MFMGRIKACKLLSYVHVSSIILQKHSHKQEKIYICTCMLTHRPFVLGEKKFKLNALQTRKEYSHTMTCSLWSPPSPPSSRCVLCPHGSPAGPSISTAHSWPRTGTPIRCEFSVMGDSHWCKMLSTWGFVTLSYLCELKVFYGIKFFKCKFQKNCHN